MQTEYIQTIYKDGYRFTYTVAPDETLSEITSHTDVFTDIRYKEKVIAMDLLKMLQKESRVDWSLDVKTFIESRITTDTLAYRYKAQNRPKTAAIDGKYTKRVKAYDPVRDPKTQIESTSLKTPSLRDDPRYKASLLDLVVSSSEKTFENHLAAINGVFHRALTCNGELFILAGYSNIVNENACDVALFDTTDIGGHHCVSISSDMIENTPEQSKTQSIYLRLPENIDLKNTTPCLVLNGSLYAFDETITPLSGNRLKIHMNQIDYIHEYLHNPNTPFRHDMDKELKKHPFQHHASLPEEPPVEDRITHLLKCLMPFEKRNDLNADVALTEYDFTHCDTEDTLLRPINEKLNASTLDEDRNAFFESKGFLPCRDQGPPPLTSVDTIAHFLTSVYPNRLHPDEQYDTSLIEYNRSEIAKHFKGIFPTIPIDFLCSEAFLTYLLTSPHTYLVLLQNPHIYVKKTPLGTSHTPTVHNTYDPDIPCGFLQANHTRIYPYTITSSPTNHHLIYHPLIKTHKDIYKSIHIPAAIPSPIHDPKSLDQDIPLNLVDIYSGT